MSAAFKWTTDWPRSPDMQVTTVGAIDQSFTRRQKPPCRVHADRRTKIQITRMHHVVDVLKKIRQHRLSNRIKIFNAPKTTGVITKSTKAKSICGQLQKWLVKQVCLLVCVRNRSGRKMTEYQETSCSRGWMQQLEMNVGWRKLDDMPEPASGVMRMSADDDDQADQQRETRWYRYGGDRPFSARITTTATL